jgi:hypothetical protein
MGKCGSNMMYIGRPTEQDFARASCNAGNPNSLDCPDDIGPRPNRERVKEEVRDYVLLMLGAPVIKIELDIQQLNKAVDQAMKYVEEFAPRDFFNYYNFVTEPGKSVYKLPPDIGVVRNVFYKKQARMSFNAQDLGGSIPLEYFAGSSGMGTGLGGGGMINPVSPMWGAMGEWVLYKQYEQMFSRTSSQIGGWEWVNDHRHIKLYPVPCGCEKVIVHYLQKCKDWQEVLISMQEGALAYAKVMLGRIRSKYQGTYGPSNSGLQLDGQQLVQEGQEELKEWKDDLINKWGDILPITMD